MSKGSKWLEKNVGKAVQIIVHVVAWVLFLAFYQLSYIQQSDNVSYRFAYVISIGLVDIPVFYALYSWAIPKFLVRKKVGVFLLITVFLLAVTPMVRLGIDMVLIEMYPNPEDQTPFVNISISQFWIVYGVRALGTLFVIVMAGIGKFTFDWFDNLRIRRELENQNLTSELAFLKSQLNPHFLFNTLNNIHTLAYKKSDEAPDAIMMLSELMRYMTYESEVDFVPLKQEVSHLKSFIVLNELRFKDRGITQFQTAGDLENKKIAPLLLLPFIENAFKHGQNKPGDIQVELNAEEGIEFSVVNQVYASNQHIAKDEVGGVGLDNIKRRLALIYPDRYTLNIHESSDQFKIDLKIDINVSA